jgi:hypothetical protein
MRRLPPEPVPIYAPLSRWLGWAAIGLGMLSILAIRFGGVPHRNGLMLLGIAILLAVLAIVAALIAFAAIWNRGSAGTSLAAKGLLLATMLLASPAYFAVAAIRLPVLNDVVTDIADPPSFSRSRAALDARGGYLPPEFDRERIQEQTEEYGDLRAVVLEQPAEEVMGLVQRAATNLGWLVVDTAQPTGRTGTGRVDAVARSMLYRFPDDITIRIRQGVGETRVDLRSASRIGRHDFGANARHIRDFTREIEALANLR